jgi:catechol 2,3-dioxygenase-like lactoylglutathione lyase family enzyme
MPFESINAITLATHDMAASVAFYTALGLAVHYGGPQASFTSFEIGPHDHLNLIRVSADSELGSRDSALAAQRPWWGRVILYVSDVDAPYQRAIEHNLQPLAPPRDAEWRERYFHIRDPDGHEISIAKPL